MRFLLLSLLIIGLSIGGCIQSKEAGVRVKIEPENIISFNFLGNGVQWSAYPHADSPDAEWGALMQDEQWNTVFERLDFMKPRIVRVIDQANWRYLQGFDEKGNPIVDYETPEMKSLERLLGYCQSNGIDVLFGEWGAPYQVHDTDAGYSGILTGANDPVWINMIVDYLDFMINEKGYTCIKYYNLVNEPNGDWASTNGDWNEWSSGIKMLHERLEEKGLIEQVSIAGPDAVAHYDHPESKYTGTGWVIESIRQLDSFIGLYDVHAYTDFELVKSGGFSDFYEGLAELADSVDKPIIFGELGFGRDSEENQERIKADPYASSDSQMAVYDFSYGIDMADALIQLMSVGYDGAIAWSLDDAMHTLGDLGEKDQLKRWGMWNILGEELHNNPGDEAIRPWYYSWSLMTRYFVPGTEIIGSIDTGEEGLRYVAGKYKNQWTIAFVNNSEKEHGLFIELSGERNFRRYRYEKENRLVNEKGFPKPQSEIRTSKEGWSMAIPANSFTLLTTHNFNK